MNINKYDKSIQDLYNKQQEYLQLLDPRVLDVLNQLLKKAKKLKDDELIGYTYHSLAFLEYFVLGHYDLFLKNLTLSFQHLLKVEDKTEILHVYYLIAIDALNKGIYDLAYHFFMSARNVAIETKQETSEAILNENIAHILILLGAYKQARNFLKKSIRGVRKNPNHPHYYNNYVSCYINDANCCLNLYLLDEAQEDYKNVDTFMQKNPDQFQLDAYINFALLGTRIAIKQDNKKLVEKRVDELVKLIKEITQAANYINDITKVVSELLEIKEYKLAGKIIDSISKKDLASDAISAHKRLIESKLAYYQAIDNKDELLNAYLEQDRIMNREIIEQRNSNTLSQDLISFTNILQQQQESILKQRESLEIDANTDGLTGIANRYRINTLIDEAFEDAYHNKTYFAIGLLDLDGLKAYNDKYGHQAGDKLIIENAKALSKLEANKKINIARYGGDEFLILFKDMDRKEINSSMKELHTYTDNKFSIGICLDIPQDKQKPWDYLMVADAQLYKVKNNKKKKENANDLSISRFR